MTKETLPKVIETIANYNKSTTNTPANKNGYVDVLVNQLIKTPALLPTYITALKSDLKLTLLGSDKATQNTNYSKLLPLVDKNKPEYKDLLAIKFLIDNQKTEEIAQSIKENLNQVIDQYGVMFLNVIEWVVWGKWKLAEFCKKWKLDQYFPAIEKFYETHYSLTPAQKIALEAPYKLEDTFKWSDKVIDNDTEIVTCSKKNIQDYYSGDRLDPSKNGNKDNFHLLDPVLVSRAIQDNKLSEFSNLIIPGDRKNGEQEYKFNDAIKLTTDQQKKIVTGMVKDPSIWNNIAQLNQELRWEKVYGKKNSEAAENKVMSDENDVAMTFGVCLMKGSRDLKYVISETKELPNRKNKKDTKEVIVQESESKKFFDSFEKITPEDIKKLTIEPLSDVQKTQKKIILEYSTKLFAADHLLLKDSSNTNMLPKLTIFMKNGFPVYIDALTKDLGKDQTKNKEKLTKLQSFSTNLASIEKDFVIAVDPNTYQIKLTWKNKSLKDISFNADDLNWTSVIA